MDKIDGICLKSYSALYSAMLRLRGLFIIKCVLKKNKFSNEKFKNRLIGQGLNIKEFEDSYKAYRLVRDDMAFKDLKINISVAEKVLNILEGELALLEAQIYGKQKKEA